MWALAPCRAKQAPRKQLRSRRTRTRTPAPTKRLLNVKVTLFDETLKAAVALQGASNQLTVDTCVDGVKNNAETDLDCGGGQCPGCGT